MSHQRKKPETAGADTMWKRWVICPTTMARTRDTKPRRVLCEPAQYTLHTHTQPLIVHSIL